MRHRTIAVVREELGPGVGAVNVVVSERDAIPGTRLVGATAEVDWVAGAGFNSRDI